MNTRGLTLKKLIILITGLTFISGCANNRVSLGEDHFRMTKLPTSGLDDQASMQKAMLAEATKHCQRIKPNSTIQIHSQKVTTQAESGSDSILKNVELEYTCRNIDS